jgi:hypothetical protein
MLSCYGINNGAFPTSSMYCGFADDSMQVQVNKYVATVTVIVRTIDVLMLAMKAIKGIMSEAC